MKSSTTSRKAISSAKINPLFPIISEFFGYNPSEWAQEIVALVDLWEQQGYVEIYQTKDDRKHGLIKDSSTNEKGILCPFYIGLFHARLATGESDPLIIIKFHEEGEEQFLDLKFMLDHDDIFGDRAQKNDPQQLRIIWKNIDDFVKQSDDKI